MAEINELSKRASPKLPKLLDSTKYVFMDVDMKSPVWIHFKRDKKHGVAKCKKCDSILKVGQSTSALIRHLKTHLIDIKSKENSQEEPPSKKGKMESFYSPKVKPPELQELVAKIRSGDGFSFSALAKSESLQFVF